MLLLFLAYMNIFIHDFLHAYIIEQIVLTLLVHYLTSIKLSNSSYDNYRIDVLLLLLALGM